MTITHAFVSAKSDGSDATLLRPSNWNASHVIGDGTMTINASSSVGTFALTSGSLTALTLGTTTLSGGFGHVFDFGNADAPSLDIKNSSSGTGGPTINFEFQTSSPTADDFVGGLSFNSKDSAGNRHNYSLIDTIIIDPTNGAERSKMLFSVMIGATLLAGLSIGVNDPTESLYSHVFDLGVSDFPAFVIKNSSTGAGGPELKIFQDSSSPVSGDNLGFIQFWGRNSAAGLKNYAQFIAKITGAGAGTENSTVQLDTSVSGTSATRMIVAGGVYHPSATGTDKGNNSTNFSAQYDDGTLLTCYVDEAARTGKVDIDYWDSKVENATIPAVQEKVVSDDGLVSFREIEPPKVVVKTHDPVRKFAARLGTEYDPTTLTGQRKHLRDKRHLTPYQNPDTWSEDKRPSMGKWIQCGVEMDELLFLYITQLEDRLLSLESKA